MQTRSKSATHVTKSIHSATPPHGKTTRAQSAPALIRKECSSLHKELETLQTAYNALKEEKRRLAEENILLTETLRVYYRNVLYMAIRKLYSRAQADQAGCPLVADHFIGPSSSTRTPHFPSVPPPTDLPVTARRPWSQLFDADQIFDALRILRHIGSHESNAWDLKQAILHVGPDVSTHLKDVARAGFSLVTGCSWDEADKRHRFSDGNGLYQRALAAKRKQTSDMVQQQMTAMSKAEFTFVCSKESGQVSCAPPSVAGSSVTQIVSSERRNETVSSGSGSSSKDDSQRATLSPSLAPEGWEAGTDDDMDLGARGESDDQEDIIFVKMTVAQSAIAKSEPSSFAAKTASTLYRPGKRKASPEQPQSLPFAPSTVFNPNLLPVSVKRQRTLPGSCAAVPIDLTLPDDVVAIRQSLTFDPRSSYRSLHY